MKTKKGPFSVRAQALAAAREQTANREVTIAGYAPGTKLQVLVTTPDFSMEMLSTGIINPLVAVAAAQIIGEKPKNEEITDAVRQAVAEEAQAVIQRFDLKTLGPVLDAVAKATLVEPTYEELVAIKPLTMQQKLDLFNEAIGKVLEHSRSFRQQPGVPNAGADGQDVEQGA